MTPSEWATHIQILVVYSEDRAHHPNTPYRMCTHNSTIPSMATISKPPPPPMYTLHTHQTRHKGILCQTRTRARLRVRTRTHMPTTFDVPC